MKHTRKFLSLALALIMCLSLTPMTAFAGAYDEMYQSAQILNSANGDGTTPFNLQWVDGANGLISFDVQTDDLYDSTGMVGTLYMVYVFRDGVNTGEEAVSSRNVGGTATADISAHMDINGSYEFLVCYSGMGSPIGEIAKSTPYALSLTPSTPQVTESSNNQEYPPQIMDFNQPNYGSRRIVSPYPGGYIAKGTMTSLSDIITVSISTTLTLDNVNFTNNYMEGVDSAIDIRGSRDNPIEVTLVIDGDNYLTSLNGPAYRQSEVATVNVIGDGTLTLKSNSGGNYAEILGQITVAPTVTIIDESGSFPGSTAAANTATLPSAPVTPPVVPPTTPVQPTVPAQQSMTVLPTPSKVFVNGVETSFEAYHIDGSNYFKLRDIAFVLNGTIKQFNLGYDSATAAITLLPGQPYVPAGGEMTAGDGQAKPAMLTASKIYLNGGELSLTVYNIAGSNFFKLVDLMSVLNVGVTYNSTTGAISIDTNAGFMGVITVSEPTAPVPTAPIQTPTPPVVTPTTPSTGGTALSKGLYFYPIADEVEGKFYQLASFQLEFTDKWGGGTDLSLSDITDVVVYLDGVPNQYTLDFVDDLSHAITYRSSLVRYDAGTNANRFTQYPATYTFSFKIKGVEFTQDMLTSFTVSADGTVQYTER